MKKYIFILSALFFSSSVFAMQSRYVLGVDGGMPSKSNVTNTAEVENSGLELNIVGGYKVIEPLWLAEANIGWHIDRMSSNNVEVSTKAFLLETSARYRLNDNVSIGPALQALIGTDVSFSDTGTNSDDKIISLFAGVKADYRLPYKRQNLFAGLHINTDVNIANRQITRVLGTLRWEWEHKRKSYTPIVKTIRRNPTPAPTRLTKEGFRVNLKNSGVRFALDSADLVDNSKVIIERIGLLLGLFPEEWTHMQINGHTDTQGSQLHNLELSLQRAGAVKTVLRRQGVSERRMLLNGLGATQPLAKGQDDITHSINRRVELKIGGVKKHSSLEVALQKLFEKQ